YLRATGLANRDLSLFLLCGFPQLLPLPGRRSLTFQFSADILLSGPCFCQLLSLSVFRTLAMVLFGQGNQRVSWSGRIFLFVSCLLALVGAWAVVQQARRVQFSKSDN